MCNPQWWVKEQHLGCRRQKTVTVRQNSHVQTSHSKRGSKAPCAEMPPLSRARSRAWIPLLQDFRCTCFPSGTETSGSQILSTPRGGYSRPPPSSCPETASQGILGCPVSPRRLPARSLSQVAELCHWSRASQLPLLHRHRGARLLLQANLFKSWWSSITQFLHVLSRGHPQTTEDGAQHPNSLAGF